MRAAGVNLEALVAIYGGQRTARPTSERLAPRNPGLRNSQTRSAVRRGIFVEPANQKWFKLRRSGICRPDGAGEFCGVGFYKDFAPDGAEVKG